VTGVKCLSRLILFCACLAVLSSCERIIYWQHLPTPSASRVVWVKGDTESIKRAIEIGKKLVAVKPFPAVTVFVMTNEYRFASQKLPQIPDRAHTQRCRLKGEEPDETLPPSSACIWIPAVYLTHLSDEALAGILAHELGHIEKGHRSWEGSAEPTLIQWEADEAALERLTLAGYCAGMAMRKYGNESVRIYGPGWRHPWQTYPVDCKPKSPEP